MMRKISEFIISSKNNIFVDDYMNRLLYGNQKRKYTVSPSNINKYRRKYDKTFHIIYPVFILLSPVISVFKLTYEFVKFSINKLALKQGDIGNSSDVILLTTRNALRFLEIHGFENSKIITTPSSRILVDDKFKDKCISTLKIVTFRGLIMNYLSSLITIGSVWYHFGYRNVIYSANSFEWFLMYDVIKILNEKVKTILFSNQKDRWAILYDRNFKGQKVLLQHGTNIIRVLPSDLVKPYLNFIQEYNVWSLQMPVKYRSINTLYAFNEIEADVMIDGEFDNKPDITIFIGYSLVIKPYHHQVEDEKRVLLLIGNSSVFNIEEAFFINKLSKEKFHLLIKPHPNSNIIDYSSYNKVATLVNFNPEVDIVVSYNSTLAYEYESLGYAVIIYKDLNNLKEIVEKLNIS